MTSPPNAPEAVALELLSECAKQFRFYEENHRAKGAPEAYEKSKVNGEFAHRIECFLASGVDYLRTPATPPNAESGEMAELVKRIDAEVARITGHHPLKSIIAEARAVLLGDIRAALSRSAGEPGVSNIPPREPSGEMIRAGMNYLGLDDNLPASSIDAAATWRAMYDAFTPPASEPLPVEEGVIQADRDAAWPWCWFKAEPNAKQFWNSGVYDDQRIIQAFRAHRVAAVREKVK